MLKILRLLVVFAAVCAALPQPAAAQRAKDDVVTLKDGRVIRGKIIEFFPNDSTFLMRMTDGTFSRFNKADIASIDQGTSIQSGDEHYNRKNPALAWLLSFLITGGGQIYNEDTWKGLGLLIFGGAGTVLYLSGAKDDCVQDECDTKRAVGGIIAVSAWLGSMIEAPIKASAINREIAGRRMALSVWPEPHKLGVSLVRLDF